MKERYDSPDTYAVWSKNEDVRYQSTSGGAFSEFAKIILKKGGFVAGAAYDENNLVKHIVIDNIKDLEKIRQSKYLSSRLEDVFINIKEHLDKGDLVCFCGAPCQVAGLYSFLGKAYEKLITLDFICRGMNSPKAFMAWKDEIEKREGSKISRVWFKYKDGGWKTSPKRTRLDFYDGHTIIKSDTDNLYMFAYLSSNLYIRPSCGNCRFKGVPRQSDITMADFWGIDKSLDDDKGTSMILINSKKGNDLFREAQDGLHCHKRSFLEIFDGNTCFNNSVNVPDNSELFLKDLSFMPFSDALKKYGGFPIPEKKRKIVMRKIKHLVKRALVRVGVITIS